MKHLKIGFKSENLAVPEVLVETPKEEPNERTKEAEGPKEPEGPEESEEPDEQEIPETLAFPEYPIRKSPEKDS